MMKMTEVHQELQTLWALISPNMAELWHSMAHKYNQIVSFKDKTL